MAAGTVHNPELRRTRVYDYRKQKNLSLIELSELTGIRKASIHKYEIGLALPRVDNALELAAVFGCTVEDLFHEAFPRPQLEEGAV